MARREGAEEIVVIRSWMWTTDATWRWRRAFRLLLTNERTDGTMAEQEDDDGSQDRTLRARIDRATGTAADQ